MCVISIDVPTKRSSLFFKQKRNKRISLLSKPHIIFWSALTTGFLFSYPAKRFKSNWMAVIIHGAEGLFILFLIIGIVLGVE